MATTFRMLWRLRQRNQRWRIYDNFLVAENRWRAARMNEPKSSRSSPVGIAAAPLWWSACSIENCAESFSLGHSNGSFAKGE